MHLFRGTHIIADFYGISKRLVPEELLTWLSESCIKNSVTLVDTGMHKFENGGFTIYCLLAESHISMHYYIEQHSAFVDIFTCGYSKPENLLNELKDYCIPQENYTYRFTRGLKNGV